MPDPMIVKVVDEATPFMKSLGQEAPKYVRRSIKSAGWWMKKEIQTGIETGAPGGQPYEPPSPITLERTFDAMRGRGRTKKGKWRKPKKLKPRKHQLGRLKQAVRYKYYPDSVRAVVGWVSKSAEGLGELHEKGGTVPITGPMRRFYWAAGVPLSNKPELRIPARPTIGPEYRAKGPQIPSYVENKIFQYIEEAAQKTQAQVVGG